MITESNYELTPIQKEQLEKLLQETWAYLNDIAEKNEHDKIPNKFMERYRCVNELLRWVDGGMQLND